MNWTQKEIQETMVLCKSKAMTDNEFRMKLLNDPATAIKELTGKEIPQGVKLQVLEQDPSADMTFVLPPASSGELSDDELDKIAAAKIGWNKSASCFVDPAPTWNDICARMGN